MGASSLFDLSGRTALVTGSSGGLGFAMAAGLAEAGTRLVLNGRDGARLEAAAHDLAKSMRWRSRRPSTG
jgi:gluconate 5-dehydrogenase